jgi:hypothetical protein
MKYDGYLVLIVVWIWIEEKQFALYLRCVALKKAGLDCCIEEMMMMRRGWLYQ